jgi:hypothetical protein
MLLMLGAEPSAISKSLRDASVDVSRVQTDVELAILSGDYQDLYGLDTLLRHVSIKDKCVNSGHVLLTMLERGVQPMTDWCCKVGYEGIRHALANQEDKI